MTTGPEELRNRTKRFAVRIVKLYKSLSYKSDAQVLGKQLLRCGTSVAANYRARSKAEWVSRIGIVVEEADEAVFWLEMLIDCEIVPESKLSELLKEGHRIDRHLLLHLRTRQDVGKRFKITNYPIAELPNLMRFSDQFEARFSEMLTHYPTKRSVLVPTLLYAQDEVGYLSDEVIAELALRLGLTELDVRNVVSYYSMLTTKPRGKFNVQVCTNIACLLRGGEELLDHCEKKLGVGHKGTTPDGLFSLEEVECIGACSWAPAVQVNYDFHENLTPEKMDRVLDGYRSKGAN